MRIVSICLAFVFVFAVYVSAQNNTLHRGPHRRGQQLSADSNLDDDSDIIEGDFDPSIYVPIEEPLLEDSSVNDNDDKTEGNVKFSEIKDSNEEFIRQFELSNESRMEVDSNESKRVLSNPMSIRATSPLTRITSEPTTEAPKRLPQIQVFGVI